MNAEDATKICLFDMDDTLFDHSGALERDMALLKSPNEPDFRRHDESIPLPDYIAARRDMVRSQRGWWENLDPLPLGFDLMKMAQEIGFIKVILTKGPWTTPYAWTEKVHCARKHCPPDVSICMVENITEPSGILTPGKALVYGRVLVDDYPPYCEAWLKYRPRGVVIYPAKPHNADWKHPNAFRYDGTNCEQIREVMQRAYNRKSRDILGEA